MLRIIIVATFLVHAYAQKAAIVYLVDPTGASRVTGNVTFTESKDGIVVAGKINGLAPGNHGFHIHNLGNIAGGCTETGPHFNPHNLTHGAPGDTIRHVGDLGNIVAASSGEATLNFVDTVITFNGEDNIIGRAVVVHSTVDDLGKGGNSDSLATGNAGGRVACGVIGILRNSASTIHNSIIIITMTLLFICVLNKED